MGRRDHAREAECVSSAAAIPCRSLRTCARAPLGHALGKQPPLEDHLWESLKIRTSTCRWPRRRRIWRRSTSSTGTRWTEFAVRSQQLAKQAWDSGVYDDEVIGVQVRTRRRSSGRFRPRRAHAAADTMDALKNLKPYFKSDGVVTAGNASGIGDGAGALVIASEEWAKERGHKPLGRLYRGTAGVDRRSWASGPFRRRRRRSPTRR